MELLDSQERLNILILEDDHALRQGLTDLFIFHGFSVDAVSSVETAKRLLSSKVYDAAILDWMLPDGDGVELGTFLREHDPDCSLLFLTARCGEMDRIQGLACGADDYVTKPFSSRELVLRVQNILRRAHGPTAAGKVVEIGSLQVDTLRRLVHLPWQERPVELSKRELETLLYLHSRASLPTSRADILRNVWGYNRSLKIETRTVDIHIAKLRKKLEQDPAHPKMILTERGDGYRLEKRI